METGRGVKLGWPGRRTHQASCVAAGRAPTPDRRKDLALLHQFSFKKAQAGGNAEFRITVKELAERNSLQMRFFARADREVNQDVAPFVPFGWGVTLLDALTECLKGVRQYPCRPGAPPAMSHA